MKKTIFNLLFIVSVVGVISGILLQIKWFDYIFKPLIMISVGGYFLSNSKHFDQKIVTYALIAFVFSLAGDSFLMFVNRGMNYFISGLASFLVAQIGYILLFLRTVKISGNQPFLKKGLFWLTVYIIYGGTIYLLLFNRLDFVLKIAVFIYMIALLGMSATALNRFKTVGPASFILVFAGSILFVISDSLIAVDKFLVLLPNDRFLVMATYMPAQYLIMRGVLKQFSHS